MSAAPLQNRRKAAPALILFLAFAVARGRPASADVLPYSTRTHAYDGLGTAVRGDIRTVGMAGATLGVADTFLAAFDNPAGLAMTLTGADLNFSTNSIQDSHVQDFNSAVQSSNFGVASMFYPWGASVGYVAPYEEIATYTLLDPTLASQMGPTTLSISTRELRFSVAKTFFHDRVSVGGSLNLGQSEEEIDFQSEPSASSAYHGYSLGATVGALYRLPGRQMLALSYTTPMDYEITSSTPSPAALPGFFEPVEVPYRAGIGYGWIPNRFFKVDANLFLYGSTQNTALASDDSIMVGVNPTLQPRMGCSYIFAEFPEIKGTAFGGSYYEISNIAGAPSRPHLTMGTEVKLWVFGVGLGLDTASEYRDFLFSFGVDIFKVFGKLGLIPVAPHAPYGGLLPRPFLASESGLPRPLLANPRDALPGVDPIKAGLDFPSRVQEKVKSASSGDVGNQVLEGIKAIPKALSDEIDTIKKVQKEKEKREKKLIDKESGN